MMGFDGICGDVQRFFIVTIANTKTCPFHVTQPRPLKKSNYFSEQATNNRPTIIRKYDLAKTGSVNNTT